MKQITICSLLVSMVLSCCSSGSNSPVESSTESPIAGEKFVVTGRDCDIHLEADSIDKNQLIGSWIDSLVWFPNDSCYVGGRPVESKMYIDFYGNGRYKFIEVNHDTALSYIEEGQYWTYSRNDSAVVVLAEWHKKEPIKDGDTIIASEWLLYSVGDNQLKMRFGHHEQLSPNITQFRKAREE